MLQPYSLPLVLTFFFCSSYPLLLHAHDLDLWVPPSPPLPVKAYLMIDADTKQVLASRNSAQEINSAMLEPLLLLYTLGQSQAKGELQWDQTINIKSTPRTSNKIMSLKENEKVKLWDLIKALIISQAPDALYALKESALPQQTPPESQLRSTAGQLELNNSFTRETTSTTAHDVATLGQALIRDVKAFLPLYKQKSFTRNNKEFSNSNLLLNTDSRIQGMYVSHSETEGHSLVAYGVKKPQRWIIVILGARSQESVELTAKILMNYAERFYKKVDLSTLANVPAEKKVWGGKSATVLIQPLHSLSISVPASLTRWNAPITWVSPIIAPIQAGEEIGFIDFKSKRGDLIYHLPIKAAHAVNATSSLKYYWDYSRLALNKLIGADHL